MSVAPISSAPDCSGTARSANGSLSGSRTRSASSESSMTTRCSLRMRSTSASSCWRAARVNLIAAASYGPARRRRDHVRCGCDVLRLAATTGSCVTRMIVRSRRRGAHRAGRAPAAPSRRRGCRSARRRAASEARWRGHADREALAFTAGELRRTAALETFETDVGQQLPGSSTLFRAPPVGTEHRDLDVVERAQMRQQVVQLEDETHPLSPIAAGVVEGTDVFAIDAQRARVGRLEGGEQVQQRGLARSGRPGESHVVARRHDEVQAVERDDLTATPAEGLADVDGFDRGRGRATHDGSRPTVRAGPHAPRGRARRGTRPAAAVNSAHANTPAV